jgi:hypothetical protein
MSDENLKHAEEQARAQLSSIIEMVAALEVDYDRLEELRDERNELPDGYEIDPVVAGFIWKCEALNVGSDRFDSDEEAARAAWSHANPDDAEELTELEEAAGDCESRDDAYERIQEDPLSIEVRTGWYSPGEAPEPEEFNILLCTGGPAVRIIGELDQYKQPCRAWIEYQDWFTPWAELVSIEAYERDALLTYCQQFYFGG